MPYIFMSLWLIFGVIFIVGGIIWIAKRKSGKLTLISLGLSVACLIIGSIMIANEPLPTETNISVEVEKEDEKKVASVEFDERAWRDFIAMYKTHNNLMNAMDGYAEGNISKIDFYDYCKEIEDWFAKASISFKYWETDDEKDYISTFEIFAISGQIAAKNLMAYLDSGKTSDLSVAREHIDRANEAVGVIVNNRIHLLRKMGLTDEQIEAKKDEMISDVENIGQEG